MVIMEFSSQIAQGAAVSLPRVSERENRSASYETATACHQQKIVAALFSLIFKHLAPTCRDMSCGLDSATFFRELVLAGPPPRCSHYGFE
jgi:hypothetical protein